MRTQILSGIIQMEYPENIVMLYDNNVIKINSLNNKVVGARLTLTVDQTSVILEYQSELPNLIFKLWDTLMRLTDGQHTLVTVTGNISNDSVGYQITPFTFYVEQGRTLNSRTAGNVRTMYWSDTSDLAKVNIYTPIGGTAIYGNSTFVLNQGVNKLNLSTLQVNGDFYLDIHLSYPHNVDVVFFGDLWKHYTTDLNQNTRYQIYFKKEDIGNECNPYVQQNYGKIKFLNVDGCYVTFIGKVIKEKYSNAQNIYATENLVVKTPNALVYDCIDEVTIAFQDIEHSAYIYDIMYSPDIQYVGGDGNWYSAVMSANNITQEKEDYNDLEITLKILA